MYDELSPCTSLIVPVNEPNYSIYREIQQIKHYLSPKKNATPCEIRRKTLEILIKENEPPKRKTAKNSSEIYDLLVNDETIDEKYRTNLTKYRMRGLIGNLIIRMPFLGGTTEIGYYFRQAKYDPDDRLDILEFVQEYRCTPSTDKNIFEIDI